MKMDKYELDLLDTIDNSTTEFTRVDNFKDEVREAEITANNFLKAVEKTKQADKNVFKDFEATLNDGI